jgi:hypothetical protein
MKLSDHTIFFQSRIKMHLETQNKTPLATLMYCKCHQLFNEHMERQINGRWNYDESRSCVEGNLKC